MIRLFARLCNPVYNTIVNVRYLGTRRYHFCSHRRSTRPLLFSFMNPITADTQIRIFSKPAYAWHENVESLENYGPGGYHPVHLGDRFSAGRYEVVHKLGHGRYSTIWLCKDLQEQDWVSVKVTISDDNSVPRRQGLEHQIYRTLRNGNPEHPGKRFVNLLLDDFLLNGPNGQHQCFVFPFAMDNIAIAKEASISDNHMFPTGVARSIVTQLLLALSYIHSCGIVHADLHNENILIQASSAKPWPLPLPYEDPEELHVCRYDGMPIGSQVPKYQIQAAASWVPSDMVDLGCKILVTDFGEAFFTQTPDKVALKLELNSPVRVRPLDRIFGYSVTSAADIWTAGIGISDIVGRDKLFQHHFQTEDTVILEAISTLGQLPPKMLQSWPNRSMFFGDNGSWQEAAKPSELELSRPLIDRLRTSVSHETHSTIYGHSDEELRSMEKMLLSMLRYDPNDRITADEALRSEWARDYGIPALLKSLPEVNLSSLQLESKPEG